MCASPATFPAGPLAPCALINSPVRAPLPFRWCTALGSNPLTIITQDQTPTGRLNMIEQTMQQSLSVWAGVRVLYPDPGDTLYVGNYEIDRLPVGTVTRFTLNRWMARLRRRK
jgi:hypothetical protein